MWLIQGLKMSLLSQRMRGDGRKGLKADSTERGLLLALVFPFPLGLWLMMPVVAGKQGAGAAKTELAQLPFLRRMVDGSPKPIMLRFFTPSTVEDTPSVRDPTL